MNFNELSILLILQVIFPIHSIEPSSQVFYRSNSVHSRNGNIDELNLKPGYYVITVAGARGGNFISYFGGKGFVINATMNITKPTKLKLVVGNPGQDASRKGLAGGGGGSFVIVDDKSVVAINNGLLIAAGGGGGGCVIESKKGQDASGDTKGKDATLSYQCRSKKVCIGKGGENGNYGSFPSNKCRYCDQGVGGMGGSWKGNIPAMPAYILKDRSGKSGNGPNGVSPFAGGKGIFSGGFGGGGGGGGGQNDGDGGGSGAGGGYSGGGVGFSVGSCGGGGGSYLAETSSILPIQLSSKSVNKKGSGMIKIISFNAIAKSRNITTTETIAKSRNITTTETIAKSRNIATTETIAKSRNIATTEISAESKNITTTEKKGTKFQYSAIGLGFVMVYSFLWIYNQQ